MRGVGGFGRLVRVVLGAGLGDEVRRGLAGFQRGESGGFRRTAAGGSGGGVCGWRFCAAREGFEGLIGRGIGGAVFGEAFACDGAVGAAGISADSVALWFGDVVEGGGDSRDGGRRRDAAEEIHEAFFVVARLPATYVLIFAIGVNGVGILDSALPAFGRMRRFIKTGRLFLSSYISVNVRLA